MLWLIVAVTGLVVASADLWVRRASHKGTYRNGTSRNDTARDTRHAADPYRNRSYGADEGRFVTGNRAARPARPTVNERPGPLRRRRHRLTAPRRPPNRTGIRRESWPTQRSG